MTLEKVMSKLGECGIKLKRTKCKFMLPSVEYLGYHISGEGISPTKERRRAIVDPPVPEDISQLKSFWGLVNYYAKFCLVLQTHWHHCTSCSPNTNHGVRE